MGLSGEQHAAMLKQLEEKTKALRESIEAIPSPIVSRLADIVTQVTESNKHLGSIDSLTEGLMSATNAQLGLIRDGFKDNKAALDAIDLAIQMQTDQLSPQNIVKANLDSGMHTAYDAWHDGMGSQTARSSGDVSASNKIGALGQEAIVLIRPDPDNDKLLNLVVTTQKNNRYLYRMTEGLSNLLYRAGGDFDGDKSNITPADALAYLDITRQAGIGVNVNSKKLKHIRKTFLKDLLTVAGAADENANAFKYLWRWGPTQFALANQVDTQTILPYVAASIKQSGGDPIAPDGKQPVANAPPPPPEIPTHLRQAWITAVRDRATSPKTGTDVSSKAGDVNAQINSQPLVWLADEGEYYLALTLPGGGERYYKTTPGLVKILYTPDNQWPPADVSDITIDDAFMFLDIVKSAGHKKAKTNKIPWVRTLTEPFLLQWNDELTPSQISEFYNKGPRKFVREDLIVDFLKPDLVTGDGIMGGKIGKRKKKFTADESQPFLRLKPQGVLNKKNVATLQQLRNAYKVKPIATAPSWGEFGNVFINLEKLNRHPSKISVRGKKGDKLMKGGAHPDLHELLFKRYNPRKKYDGGAVEMFRRLVDLSGLPAAPSSGKYKLIMKQSGGEIIAPEFPFSMEDLQGVSGGMTLANPMGAPHFNEAFQGKSSQSSHPTWSTMGPKSLARQKAAFKDGKFVLPEFSNRPRPLPMPSGGAVSSDPMHRLGILLGNLGAGGNSPEVFNEALAIINDL